MVHRGPKLAGAHLGRQGNVRRFGAYSDQGLVGNLLEYGDNLRVELGSRISPDDASSLG